MNSGVSLQVMIPVETSWASITFEWSIRAASLDRQGMMTFIHRSKLHIREAAVSGGIVAIGHRVNVGCVIVGGG